MAMQEERFSLGENSYRMVTVTPFNANLKVHIPPLTKFRPETPCGVKRSHAKISGIGIVVSPQLSFFSFEKSQNYDVT